MYYFIGALWVVGTLAWGFTARINFANEEKGLGWAAVGLAVLNGLVAVMYFGIALGFWT